MTRRRQAIKAMSDALHADACTDDEHEWCDFGDWEREAEIALDAALTILQPVAPNTGEALDTLPAGSVIRGVPTRSWSGTGFVPDGPDRLDPPRNGRVQRRLRQQHGQESRRA